MIHPRLEKIESNQAEGWAVSRFCDLPLVTPVGVEFDVIATSGGDLVVPTRRGGVTAWEAEDIAIDLTVALIQHDRGMAGVAELVAGVQRRLGVTQDLHQAALAAASAKVAAKVRRARKAARDAERARVAAQVRGSAQPELSYGVTSSLELADEAHADLEVARAARNRRGVKEALARIRKYEARAARGRAYQLEREWSQSAVAETLALAEARGEEVVEERITVPGLGGRPQRLTVTRIRSRDGLATLEASGALTRMQGQAGRAYRLCYEARIASVGVANLEGARGGLAPHLRRGWERSASELQRAYLMARLGQMEAAVGAGRKGPRRLRALRLVAGEGHCIREIAKGGDARERMTVALADALDIMASLLGLANQGR